MKKSFAAAALILAPLLAAPAFGGSEVGELSKRIGEGKKTFEKSCTTCHKIDIPLAKTMGRDQWNARIDDMVSKGLKISADDRALVVDYLTARSLFEEKCTVCHTTERIEKKKIQLMWVTTVTNMAAKNPELFTAGEKESIVAYLTMLLGTKPSL